MAKFTPEELETLKQYISDPEADVFAVFPKLQGIVGAAFARYSRAKGGFREIFLNEFLKAGVVDQRHAKELVERVLIQYGDDSVGELEGAHLAFENISNLATKEIEDSRIGGSPIEQSTRYVFYDQRDEPGNYRYLRVPEIMRSVLAEEFVRTMDFIFDHYCRLIEPMQAYFRQLKPIGEASYDIRGNKQPVKLSDLTEERESKVFWTTYGFDIRTKACDVLRVLLPACTLTNVGLFGNGRYFQHLLTKLYSHNLGEMQTLAVRAHSALDSIIPIYVKRAKYNAYRANTRQCVRGFAEQLLAQVPPQPPETAVQLLHTLNELSQLRFTEYVLALMLYEYAEHPFWQLWQIVLRLSEGAKQELLDFYIGDRQSRHDRPGRALEFGYPINFEIVADFGIYRDLHRERMKTQIRQMLTTRLGYVLPEEFIAIGEEATIHQCYELTAGLCEKVHSLLGREIAQYVTLFGHKVRWYQGMNYREALHELELRTIKQGHPSYRQVCQEMHRQLQAANPFLAQMFKFVDHNKYYWSRAESEARQRAGEARLES